jgi:hypothetical protein
MLLPTRFHQWADDVTDIVKLYDAETGRQESFWAEKEKARKAGRNLSESDWLDDAIPFDIERPKIFYGSRPALPPAPTVQPRWKPSPPIVRPTPPPKPAPRFRKPAFLTSWKTAASA